MYAQAAVPGMFENGDVWGCSFYGYTVTFPEPTDATNVMVLTIREQIGSLFVKGAKCRKSGIVFFGMEKIGAVYQVDLFAPAVKHEKSKLSGRATTFFSEHMTAQAKVMGLSDETCRAGRVRFYFC